MRQGGRIGFGTAVAMTLALCALAAYLARPLEAPSKSFGAGGVSPATPLPARADARAPESPSPRTTPLPIAQADQGERVRERAGPASKVAAELAPADAAPDPDPAPAPDPSPSPASTPSITRHEGDFTAADVRPNLDVECAGILAGRVVTTEGTPIPRAEVTLYLDPDWEPEHTIECDREGAFALPISSEGTYRLRVRASGRRPIVREQVVVAGGEYRTVPELVLSEGGDIYGFVRDLAGRPVPNVKVLLSPVDPASAPAHCTASGGDGTYRIPGVGEGFFRIVAQSPQHAECTPQQADMGPRGDVLVDVILDGPRIDATSH